MYWCAPVEEEVVEVSEKEEEWAHGMQIVSSVKF